MRDIRRNDSEETIHVTIKHKGDYVQKTNKHSSVKRLQNRILGFSKLRQYTRVRMKG